MSTHNIPFLNIKKKIILNLQLWNLFQGTQERVRTSRGKRAISVRAIKVLLYWYMNFKMSVFEIPRGERATVIKHTKEKPTLYISIEQCHVQSRILHHIDLIM